MSAIKDLNPDDYSTAEKVAIRSILSGSSFCDAATIADIPESTTAAAFTHFSQALKRVMIEAGERFISNSLTSSPTGDVINGIMVELGWQSDEDFDDTAPDYFEKQAANLQPSPSSKVDSLWREQTDMMEDIMRELGFPPLDEIDDTAPDYLENQERKRQAFPYAAQTHTGNVAQFDVTPELATARRISREAFNKAIESNPAIKADDDLRVALGTVAWEMADIMAEMPADQQQAFIDGLIAEWLKKKGITKA